jgi:hypothetical protein
VDTDHDTNDDKFTETDTAHDDLTLYVSTWQPVKTTGTNGAQVTIGSLTTVGKIVDDSGDTFTDTSEDEETDDGQGPPGGTIFATSAGIPTAGSIGPTPWAGSSSSSNAFTDDASEVVNDTTETQGDAALNVTDPMTGVITNILAGDVGKNTFQESVGDDRRS